MNEARFWRWLKDRLPPGHYTRIESDVSPGLPDVYAAMHHHGQWWIELKAVPRARYPFKRRGLRPSQRLWMATAVRFHCHVVVCGTIGSQLGIWNMADVSPDRINGMTYDELAAAAAVWCPRREYKTAAWPSVR